MGKSVFSSQRYFNELWINGGKRIDEHKKNSGTMVHEQTIPTEEPPFVGEVTANFCG
jgi:hypothetical protein